MSRRNYRAITIVIAILFFDVVVYHYQVANCSNVILLRCYPPPSQPSVTSDVCLAVDLAADRQVGMARLG